VEAALDGIWVPRQHSDGRPKSGRPRKPRKRHFTDQRFSYPRYRRALRRRRIGQMIRVRRDPRKQRAKKGSRGAHHTGFRQNYQAFVLLGCRMWWQLLGEISSWIRLDDQNGPDRIESV